MSLAFAQDKYTLKRQVFALTGKFRYYGADESLVLYSEQKMFRLREDIRMYGDEQKSQELLQIKARQIIDFSAAYDVTDAATGQKLGVLRRKGLKSILRDEWEVLDVNDQPIGLIFEDNMGLALLRRFLLGSLLPQNYVMTIRDTPVAELRQRFNLFRYELDVTFLPEFSGTLDKRVALAAGVLLATVEGKQE
jgi:uncharacterized protein YxjI